jgi:hypothetical protein
MLRFQLRTFQSFSPALRNLKSLLNFNGKFV